MQDLLEYHLDLLEQCAQSILLCGQERYVKAGKYQQSSVASHVRHILDHYHSLAHVIEAAKRDGSSLEVDYSKRQRNRACENNMEAALEEIAVLKKQLPLLAAAKNSELKIRDEAPKASSEPCSSSLARELLFVASHTVHHLAFIALLMRSASLAVPPAMGIAASTANYYSMSG